MSAVRLKPADKLGIAIFLAGLVHLVLILGLRFKPLPATAGRALDVTLVQATSTSPPHHATRLAQVNVRGGGGTHKNRAARTPFMATHQGGAEQRRTSQPHAQTARAPHLRLLATRKSRLSVTFAKPAWQLHAALAQTLGLTKQFAAEEARLKAEIRREWRAYEATGHGRGGVTAHRFAYAEYIERWNQHMEHVGSRQYQRILAGHALTGSLVLEIKIRRNGTLDSVQVLRKSPYPLLDHAAVTAVEQAAPFAPLPEVTGPQVSILPIIETWRFRGGQMAAARPSVQTVP